MVYNIKDFGAAGDGNTNDALALQKAIDACHEAGGGTVLVPAGQTFMAGSFVLKAQVELHLERGTTLLASPNYADYSREHFSDAVTYGLFDETDLPKRAWITSFEANDAAITGGGTLDGNERAFVDKDQGSGPLKNASLSFKVVANQEQVQTNEVHVVGLGEREGLSDEPRQALSQGVVEAFNVVGETAVFAYSLVLRLRNNGLVSPPEVAVADALFVRFGNRTPQQLAGGFTPTTYNTRHDLPRPFTKC